MTHDEQVPADAGLGHEEPAPEQAGEEIQAWEEIDVGRYMPRRIRGSYRGRALG